MITARLFKEDVYLKETDAEILEVSAGKEGALVILDKTVFFPTGGGQSCDTGYIDDLRVKEVYEYDGEIYHVVEGGASLSPGDRVHLQIDWDRRFDNMQRHCGEHILSGVFHALCGGVNRGFHMGDDYMTIDISLEDDPSYSKIDDELLSEAELRCNRIIWADMPLKYPSMAECLDRRIIMADWNYGSGNDCGTKTEANAFNGAAKFREMGFRVWGCGAGRSYGDSVFAPRYDFHCDNFERWLSLETEGITESTLFTSWSVHLFPFSLQEPIFARAKFRNLTRDAFEKKYACDHYGKDGTRFFDAVRLLSIPAPLSQIVELGYNQTNQKAPLNALENTLAQTTILPEKIKDLLRNYDEAAEIFRKIPGADDWLFAARHLIFRAKLALLLSGNSSARLRGEVESELDELEALTRKAFNERLLPVSAALAVDNLFPQVKEVIRKHFEILWKT